VRGRRDPLGVVKGTDIEGLDLLPADFSYRHLDIALDQAKKPLKGVSRVLDPLADHYDVAILDCPPSISLVSENVFSAADLLLVPLVPSTLSVRTFEQLQTFLADGPQPGPGVVAFLSMIDRRRRLHRELAESLPGALPLVAHAGIPVASAVELMGVTRLPLVVNHPRSPAARAYAELWSEVAASL
jgi:cellulose biosynthesis protein BcsQ